MSRLQERLDFILAYGVQGEQDLNKAAEGLSQLEERGTNVNEQTAKARKLYEQNAKAKKADATASDQLVDKQMELINSNKQAAEVVRDVTTGFELLKFEYQEGELSTEQYVQGIDELRARLDGLDAITLSTARTQNRLATAQRKASQGMKSMRGNVTNAVPAFTSMSQILQDLPFGFIAISNNIPFAAEQFQNLQRKAGGTGGAMKSLLGVFTGPGGMAIALTSLIPLIAVAAQKYGFLNTELWDTKKAGEAATDALKKAREEFTKSQDLEGVEALEEQLRIVNEQIDELEADPNRMGFWERSLLRLQAWTGQVPGARAAAGALYTTAASREEILNQLTKDRKDLMAELFGLRIAEGNEVTNLIKLQTRMNELTKESDEAFKEMLADFEIETPDLVEDEALGEALAAQQEATAQRMKNIGEQRLQFEAQLQERWLRLEMNGASRRKQINEQYAQEVDQIMNNLVLTDRQRKEALAIAQAEHADRMAQLAAEEEEQKRMEKQITADLAVDLMSSFQGFGEVIYGQGKENARRAFELNKALALATATVQGAQAVVRAYAEGGPLNAALVAGAVAAQIAKIAATKFQESGRSTSSGTKAEQFSYDFRGADSETVQGVNQQQDFPDTLRLEDSAGRFLSNLEYARDREGDAAYLTGGQS